MQRTPRIDIIAIARVCHEANRLLCIGLGDLTQPEWEKAPAWQKESAINGVNAILSGEVVAPKDSHNSWMAEKVAAGWTFGEVKDAKEKTHPCLVPFEQLPPEQQTKDMLFVGIVRGLTDEVVVAVAPEATSGD